MGLYDREYYREEPRGSLAGGARTMVMNLVFINIGIFLVDIILLNGQLSEWMSLKASTLTRPWDLWQLLTYGFAHSSQDIWHVVMNMFVLWLFGRDVESTYGRKEFLSLYLSMIVLAGVAWLLGQVALNPDVLSSPAGDLRRVVGASGACMGIAVVYAFHFPRRIFHIWGVIPVPVWAIIAVYVVKDLVGFTQAQAGRSVENIAFEAHLGGAACGALYYKTRWHLGRLLGVFGALFSGKSLKRRPKLRVHRDERQDDDLSRQVDVILAKISREGEQSLSAKERRILEDASRRYQRRDR